MITAWRITTRQYAGTAFDGEGARVAGGRWSSRGHSVVYTSSSAALATLELLVRIEDRGPFSEFVLFACNFDERLVEHVDRSLLPASWRGHPAPPRLQELGDDWIRRGEDAVLEVPSVIVESEPNYLLNPQHRDFARIAIADPIPFSLDLRLLRR